MNKLLRIAAALTGFLIVSGCSKTDEMTDQAATNLVNRIQSPVEQARAVSEKAAATRAAEFPK
jgi:outer membrane murein-binding lipoprotein Lpp